MSEPRMLVGGAALALLTAVSVGVQGCRNAAAPSRVIVTEAGDADPRAMGSLPVPPTPAKAAPPAGQAASDAGAPGTSGVAPGTSDGILVHVVGAVRKPGVYRLPPKARLTEALRAAGGAKAGADLEAVNLASFVQDGEQIRVPTLAERRAAMSAAAAPLRAPRPSRGAAAARPTRSTARYPLGAPAAAAKDTAAAATPAEAPADGPVNINTAGAAELDTLPGVGPSTAEAILQYRREHGPFRSVEELLQVSGIGAKKLAAMRDRIVVK